MNVFVYDMVTLNVIHISILTQRTLSLILILTRRTLSLSLILILILTQRTLNLIHLVNKIFFNLDTTIHTLMFMCIS